MLRFYEIINLNLQFVKRLEVLMDIFSLNPQNNNNSKGVRYAWYSKTFLCSFSNGSMTMFATGDLALSWRNSLYQQMEISCEFPGSFETAMS